MPRIARPLTALLALATIMAIAPSSMHAQTSHTTFNVAAGLSMATGRFGDDNDAGYDITAGLGLAQRGSPIGFRAEALYNQFNEKGTDNTSHAGGITLNAVYDLIPATSRQPGSLYAIGGIGYYNTREPFFDHEQNQTNFGWNVGGGFRFPLSGFSAYVEARYHSVSNVDMTFVPITFGLVF